MTKRRLIAALAAATMIVRTCVPVLASEADYSESSDVNARVTAENQEYDDETDTDTSKVGQPVWDVVITQDELTFDLVKTVTTERTTSYVVEWDTTKRKYVKKQVTQTTGKSVVRYELAEGSETHKTYTVTNNCNFALKNVNFDVTDLTGKEALKVDKSKAGKNLGIGESSSISITLEAEKLGQDCTYSGNNQIKIGSVSISVDRDGDPVVSSGKYAYDEVNP